MVGLVLVSHSQALALALKELVVAMAGPQLPIAIAAGAGDHHTELGTNAVEIVEAINAVMSDDGVLVLMDMGSALLSADTALGFLDDALRARVHCAAAPFVEGAVAAGVTATLGSSLDEVTREAMSALRHKVEHLGAPAETAPTDNTPSASVPTNAPQAVARLVIPNPHGWHARPAARFIREAARFAANVQVRNLTKDTGAAPAKSLTGLISLGIQHGHEIEISASGIDAEPAVRALQQSAATGLGDSLETAAPSPAQLPSIVVSNDMPVAVSSGLVLGPLRFATNAEPELPTNLIDDPEGEIQKLHRAIDAARQSLAGEQNALRKSLGHNQAQIFEAQSLLLDDPALQQRAESSIRENRSNAAQAWAGTFRAVAESYAQMDDEYLRERAADVRDIGARVLAGLGVARPRIGDLAQNGILVVDDLAPAEAAALPQTVLGVVCLDGGKTSHAAILLRARGVPAMARARATFDRAGLSAASRNVIGAFDGETGELWLNPSPAEREKFSARVETQQLAAEETARMSHLPAVTGDGRTIKIFANLGRASEAAAALKRGAEGVGLFRTEFLFLDRTTAPTEEEQYEALKEVCEVMGARPVIIRTLDVGGDKDAPYLGLAREANPFLGERGLRLCLHLPELFQTQLRAILRAAQGGNFQIMFPMVAELGELREARAALARAHEALVQSGQPHAWPIPVGIMIEVPSAVVLGDQLAAEADFLSIGTNDLTQYLLAADRGHPSLTRFQDAVHPAVLRMIERITAEARRFGKPVAVCGESASDPFAASLLIGLGIEELSVSPAQIPAIKATIRATNQSDLQTQATHALQCASATE